MLSNHKPTNSNPTLKVLLTTLVIHQDIGRCLNGAQRRPWSTVRYSAVNVTRLAKDTRRVLAILRRLR